jgi:uncharacterized protein YkwD
MLKELIILYLLINPNMALAQSDSIEFLVNEYRIENHLKPVVISPKVCKIADRRLKETKVLWDHVGFQEAINSSGMYGTWHENLARGFKTNGGVVRAWKKSPTHNAILLSKMRYICVRQDKGYVVLMGFNY